LSNTLFVSSLFCLVIKSNWNRKTVILFLLQAGNTGVVQLPGFLILEFNQATTATAVTKALPFMTGQRQQGAGHTVMLATSSVMTMQFRYSQRWRPV